VNLEPGVPLNRQKLGYSFDPKLHSFGFASDRKGNNALIDFWGVSIPLTKPTAGDFERSQLAGIRPLEVIPGSSWTHFLQSIEGDWVDIYEL